MARLEHFLSKPYIQKWIHHTLKMDQLVGFLLHPPLSEIAKKLGKILKYTPHFQSPFGTANRIYNTTIASISINTQKHYTNC